MNKLIVIIIPTFCEGENINAVYDRINYVTKGIPNYVWNFLFVNDGSIDDSLDRIRRLAEVDSRVKCLDFSINFGKEIALYAGAMECPDADAIICIDADLQHPPELISKIVSEWEQGAEVVATVRKFSENKSLIRKLMSNLFYRVMKSISSVDIVANTTDFRLYDKKVLFHFRKITERIYMFRATMDWLGFKTVYIPFSAPERMNGQAAYTFSKLWHLAIGSITAFSLFPLKIVGYLGGVIVAVSLPLFLWVLSNYVFKTEYGYTPLAILVVLNTLFMGVTLVAIGLVALYIAAIHTETSNRPNYVVREKINLIEEN